MTRCDPTGELRTGTVIRAYDRNGLTNHDVRWDQWAVHDRRGGHHSNHTEKGYLAAGLQPATDEEPMEEAA